MDSLTQVEQADHRAALATIYSCGLRLGEGLNLQVQDVDGQRMFLHLRGGKGNRDRYVPLPERTLIFHPPIHYLVPAGAPQHWLLLRRDSPSCERITAV